MMNKRVFVALTLALSNASAFTTKLSGIEHTTVLRASRRDFVEAAAGAFLVAGLAQPAFADDAVDDLAMPTEDEIKKAEVSH